MKHLPLLWLLAIPTLINMTDDAAILIFPLAHCIEDSTTTCAPCVLTSTVAVFVVPSTGPVRMKSDQTGDCYEIPFIQPNGTCGPAKWVPCQ